MKFNYIIINILLFVSLPHCTEVKSKTLGSKNGKFGCRKTLSVIILNHEDIQNYLNFLDLGAKMPMHNLLKA